MKRTILLILLAALGLIALPAESQAAPAFDRVRDLAHRHHHHHHHHRHHHHHHRHHHFFR